MRNIVNKFSLFSIYSNMHFIFVYSFENETRPYRFSHQKKKTKQKNTVSDENAVLKLMRSNPSYQYVEFILICCYSNLKNIKYLKHRQRVDRYSCLLFRFNLLAVLLFSKLIQWNCRSITVCVCLASDET